MHDEDHRSGAREILARPVLRLANHSASTFTGWVRTTVDGLVPFPAGEWPDGTRYVIGRHVGLDAQAVDVHVTLAPGERRKLALHDATEIDFGIGVPKPIEAIGGPIQIDGETMPIVELYVDGAAYVAHCRLRTGRMMHVDLWLRYYPDQPWAHGECMVTCSNPAVPDVVEMIERDMRLRVGDAIVTVEGKQSSVLVSQWTRFGDGQSRILPFVCVWPRYAKADAYASIQAVTHRLIGAVGITRLLPDGNPYPTTTDPTRWADGQIAGLREKLHNWVQSPIGIAATSTQTGSQYDQWFVGGEAMIGEPGAEHVAYLNACKWSNRPCHHLEAHGGHVDQQHHPQLVYWDSRPHWHRGVSPDQLGKERALTGDDTHGWWGPDRQHWLIGGLVAGYRLTGSPALQRLLEAQAHIFLLQETVDPRLSTSHSDASRSIGYAGVVATHLWHSLDDAILAGRVAQRWRDRVAIYLRERSSDDVWSVYEDARITSDLTGYTHGTVWWQQAMGAWGLDYGCRHLGPSEGREMALAGAKMMMACAYTKNGNRWVEWDNTGYRSGQMPLPASEMVEGKGAHRTGWFAVEWFPPGIATILDHEPDNQQAREIWAQMMSDSEGGRRSWFPPRME